MRHCQIFDTGPSFSRFWMVFLTQTLTQKKGFGSGDHRLIWLNFMPYYFISAAMIPTINQFYPDPLQQQGVNAAEVPVLLRDLAKLWQSNPGIDTTGRKENCSLTTMRELPTFNPRKTTVPMLKGSTHHPPLEIRLTVLF
jgi:hypothetical protein